MLNIFHAIVLFIVAFLPQDGNVSHLTAIKSTPTIVITSTPTPTSTTTQALIEPTEDVPIKISLTPSTASVQAPPSVEQFMQQTTQDIKKYYQDNSITPIPTMDVSQSLKQDQQEQDASSFNIMQGSENMWAETCRQTKMQATAQLGQQRSYESALGNDSTSGVEQSQETNIINQAQANMNGTFTLGSDGLTQNGIQFGLVDQANQLIAQLKAACTF